jgi:hypothetical protein
MGNTATESAKSKKSREADNRDIVDPMEVNLDNIRGTVVELSPREVFWRLESGAFGLNRMTGEIAKAVPKDLGDFDATCVVRGIRSGRVVVGLKERTVEPAIPNTADSLSDHMVSARRLLDITEYRELEEAVDRVFSIRTLEACLEIEKTEGKRDKFISIINSRIKQITE